MVSVRSVTESDRELLYRWANDPDVRRNAFHTEAIAWAEHVAWFDNKIKSPDTRIYIVLDEQSNPVGQVRFDKTREGSAEVDISIESSSRGHGYGAQALRLCSTLAMKELATGHIIAKVRQDNTASIKAFERSGFKPQGHAEGVVILRYEKPV